MLDWRKQFFLSQFTKKQLGLEIGPSHSPIASKRSGYNVKIIDHASQADLVKKYKKLNIDTSNIEEVDYVWDGNETLSKLVSKPHSFDYIIASHLIEHTTDLITFLEDCQTLLKPGGRLCLAIPDKRYCFDYFRFPTTAGDTLDAYYDKNIRHKPGKVFDFLINASKRGNESAWSSENSKKLSLMYDLNLAKKQLRKARTSSEYIDIHNWMFTPASFKLLIYDLQTLGLTKLSYLDEMSTQGFEFFAILSPKAPKIAISRIDLASETMNDIKIMLEIDNGSLKKKITSLQKELLAANQEINNMRQSKRWRYAEKPSKALKLLKAKND